jgi:hypothetical protein
MSDYRIRVYLRQLGLACLEVSGDLRLLPVLVRLIALAPATVTQLCTR